MRVKDIQKIISEMISQNNNKEGLYEYLYKQN